MNLASLAAGIVFKRIISGLLGYAQCEVICPDMDTEARLMVKSIPCPEYKRFPYRIEKSLQDCQGYRISEVLWADYTFLKVKSAVRHGGYDAILSFVYASNLAPLHLGSRLAKTCGLPWIVYSVDALPIPLTWNNDVAGSSRISRFINRYVPHFDAFFSANPIMLQYEKNVFPELKCHTGVMLSPCAGNLVQEYHEGHRDIMTFLYAGHIYGPRRTDLMMAGFKEYLKTHPKSRLVFVGRSEDSDFTGFESLLESGHIVRHGFTSDIETYYREADILLDLNADAENDVYLSSKVCNYLSYDKPIISLSQDGSPVRLMMEGLESIIHAHYSIPEIVCAMDKAAGMVGKPIVDRANIRNQFLPDVVAGTFYKELEQLTDNNTD